MATQMSLPLCAPPSELPYLCFDSIPAQSSLCSVTTSLLTTLNCNMSWCHTCIFDVQVTHKVACLARWMAADLYLREVDVLRFELSQNHASDEVLHE